MSHLFDPSISPITSQLDVALSPNHRLPPSHSLTPFSPTYSWENLQDHINALNRAADSLTSYKLIYIARHGQGYHNLAETTYGTPAWNCYWSEQYTDGNITWGPDATLTDLGVTQALAAKAAFTTQAAAGMPLPQVLYSSPMRRAAATLQLEWDDLLISKGMAPIVKEALR